MLVSGPSRNAERLPVALGYAQAAPGLGVDPSCIVVLDTPGDTAQEADTVREALAEGERFFLVTSASHMRRALRHVEPAGPDPVCRSVPRTRMGVGCGTDLSRACGAFASRLAPTGAQRGSPHRAGSPRAFGPRDDGGGSDGPRDDGGCVSSHCCNYGK